MIATMTTFQMAIGLTVLIAGLAARRAEKGRANRRSSDKHSWSAYGGYIGGDGGHAHGGGGNHAGSGHSGRPIAVAAVMAAATTKVVWTGVMVATEVAVATSFAIANDKGGS